MSKITEALARPGRTAGQFTAAEVTVQVIEAFFASLSTDQHVALLGALTIIYGFLQVVLENRAGKALLRTIPAPAQAEVISTDEAS